MKKHKSSRTTLEHGRDAFDRRAWGTAYAKLSAADKESPLGPGDLAKLSMSAQLIGRDVESSELLARAQRAFQQSGELESSARCAFWLGFIAMLNGELAQAGGWLARAHRLLEECGEDCVIRGYLYLPEGYRAVHSGRADAAYEAFVNAAKIGQQFHDLDLVSLARQGQGRALIRLGETTRGVSLLDEAMVAVMAGEVTPIVAGGIYCSVIESCSETFDVRRAQEWTDALERWCAEQPDLVPYRGNCLIHRAELLQLHGKWPNALDEAQKAREQFLHPKARPGVGAALYRLGELYRLRGDFQSAETAYRDAAQWGHAQKPGMALLRLAQGQVEAAHVLAVQLAEEVKEPPSRAQVLEALVEIAAAANEVACARSAADELRHIADRLSVPLLHAMSAQAAGLAEYTAGEFAIAQNHLRRALVLWNELDAPYAVAKVRLLLALNLRELGDRASSQSELKDAATVFRKLGAGPDLARCEFLLGTTQSGSNTPLTSRELEVLRLVASGKTNRAIAKRLNISEKTVARHVSNIFVKLDLSSRAAATAYAFRNNLVSAATST